MPNVISNEIDVRGEKSRWERFLSAMKSRARLILVLAIVFQTLVLVVMIARRSWPLLTGKTVLLRVEPVDPRDLFRGDYVILSYTFNRVSSEALNQLNLKNKYYYANRESEIYAVLEPDTDEKHWRLKEYSLSRPESGTFLKGILYSSGWAVFGIESFYVQEGKGHDYENAIRDKKLSTEVAVGSDGEAVVKKLIIEEK